VPVDKSDGGHDYACPMCEFTSTGWPSKTHATSRGKQHENEHATGELMQPLHEFRDERGIKVDADGKAY
jgi:hypothetical protein